MKNLREEVLRLSPPALNKDKVRQYGEVFTPFKLIDDMCNALPESTWSDPSHTILDPCAGKGQMPAVIVERLMEGLKEAIPDETERYKHIMEKQIYMGEIQRSSARDIERIFNPDGSLKLNLYVGDFLRMPEDFFDLDYETRKARYPQHWVWDETLEDQMQYPKVKKARKKRLKGLTSDDPLTA